MAGDCVSGINARGVMAGGVSAWSSSMAGVTADARLLRGGLRVVSVGSERVQT